MAKHLWKVALGGMLLAGPLLCVGTIGAGAAILTSTTTVTATPSSTTATAPVALKATVAAELVGGLLVTPAGSVTFSATAGDTTITLGSAKLSACLLSLLKCTATLTTSDIPTGTATVTASYPGDSLTGPSQGTVQVEVTTPPGIDPDSVVTNCDTSSTCNAPTVSATDGSAVLQVQGQTVSESDPGYQIGENLLSGTILDFSNEAGTSPCNSSLTGALGDVYEDSAGSPKVITYTLLGQAANQAWLATSGPSAEAPYSAVCYASQYPFYGFVPTNDIRSCPDLNAGGNEVIPATGQGMCLEETASNGSSVDPYVALLPSCTYDAPPCVSSDVTNFVSSVQVSSEVITIESPGGDPRIGRLGLP